MEKTSKKKNLEIIKFKDAYAILSESRIEARLLRENHLTDEMMTFYAMKGIFDGKVVKFFTNQNHYLWIQKFHSLRRLFGIKKGDENDE